MKQTMPLCDECVKDLKAAGYSVTQVTGWEKVICGLCGRQTFGAAYHVTKGKGGKR